MTYHTQLRPEAVEWEVQRGRYAHHFATGKQALEFEHLRRHPEYSDAEEDSHSRMVRLALQAVANLAPQPSEEHVDRVVWWLDHSCEVIAETAAESLRVFESPRAQERLISQVPPARFEPTPPDPSEPVCAARPSSSSSAPVDDRCPLTAALS